MSRLYGTAPFFVGESGRLECDYCGSSFNIAEIEALYAKKEAKAAEAARKQEETEAAQKSAEAEEQTDCRRLL